MHETVAKTRLHAVFKPIYFCGEAVPIIRTASPEPIRDEQTWIQENENLCTTLLIKHWFWTNTMYALFNFVSVVSTTQTRDMK